MCFDVTRFNHTFYSVPVLHAPFVKKIRNIFVFQTLLFVKQVLILCSRNNQHCAQIFTTALFYMLAPTCFGGGLPSSGSFWIRLIYMKI
jgi:hypothetical protein